VNIADWVGAGATSVAALVAIIALTYAARQTRSGREAAQATRDATVAATRTAEGNFLLHIEELWSSHFDVHLRLRPGGDWAAPDKGPQTSEEWARVEHYMGLFERLNSLVNNEVIQADYVARFYGYRVNNIWANEVIRSAKLERERDHWEDFIQLSETIVAARPRRFLLMERHLGVDHAAGP
jgi:hypothetical protein